MTESSTLKQPRKKIKYTPWLRNQLKSLIWWRRTDAAIDIGTSTTQIYTEENCVIFDQPTVVIARTRSNFSEQVGIESLGTHAARLAGSTPSDLRCIWPVRAGVISEYTITVAWIRYAIRQAGLQPGLIRRAIFSIPSGATQVDIRALTDAAEDIGLSEVYLVEEAVAAAVGAGLPVEQPVGSMVIDIGGGTTEIAVLSYFGKSVSLSNQVGGNRFDSSIQQYLRREHNVLIDDTTAENIKFSIGSADIPDKESEIEVTGRCLVEGLPKTIKIGSVQIRDCYSDAIKEILSLTRRTLEQTPPKLLKDIYDSQITLTGGGATLRGLDKIIQNATNIKVALAEDPRHCVARGSAMILKNLKEYRHALTPL